MELALLFSAPLLAALLPFIVRGGMRTLEWTALSGSSLVLVVALWVFVPALFVAPAISANGFWYIDPFASLLVLVTCFVQWTATMVSTSYLKAEYEEGIVTVSQTRWYFALLQVFIFSMLVTLLSNNLGVMWIALEATTLTTAFLVAFYTTDGALEAAWKYILICSVGISLGLLGMLLVFYAASQGGIEGLVGINWHALHAEAAGLPSDIMKFAFAFILIGFGTKMGLVPMHTWLPDAHAKSPSPVSAMLSGVLLNAALFAILRYKALVDGSLGSSTWSDGLFVFLGALSFALPAAFILVQENYKRLLAYSSIEHMGFIMFAFGLGPLGAAAGIVHIVGHSLSKSLLFFAAGNIFLRFKHTTIERIGAVATVLPVSGAYLLVGILTLLAVPPSPLFVSEYTAIAAAVMTHPIATVVILFSGVITVGGFIRLLLPMLLEKRGDIPHRVGETWNRTHTAMALHVALLFGIGILFLTSWGRDFITNIVAYL